MGWTQHQYDFTRRTIAVRRQRRRLEVDGFIEIDPCDRAPFAVFNAIVQQGRPILEVRIGAGGDKLFIKIGERAS